MHGYGEKIWPDGRHYQGQWCQNHMHGYGYCVYKDGIVYEGQFANDYRHGYGIYEWPDGRKYVGWWYKGRTNGLAEYTDMNKNVRNGIWEDGKLVYSIGEEDLTKIIRGDYIISKHFQNPYSIEKFPKDASLDPPSGWKEGVEDIKAHFSRE